MDPDVVLPGVRVRPDTGDTGSVSSAAPSPSHQNREARRNAWETEKRLRRRVEVCHAC